MLKPLALHTLQIAINRYLQLDNGSKTHLINLAGKVAEITLNDIKLHFFMIFTEQGIYLQSTCLIQPHITLQTTLNGLAKLASNKHQPVSFADLQIHGDIETAQKISEFFQQLDIDWEEHVAKFTGDTVAHKLANFTRRCLSSGKNTLTNFKEDIREYLQEETTLLPPSEAVADFSDDIDNLRHDIERLAVRIQRLQFTINSENSA